MKTLQHPNIVQYLGFEKKSVEAEDDVTDSKPKQDRNERDNGGCSMRSQDLGIDQQHATVD